MKQTIDARLGQKKMMQIALYYLLSGELDSAATICKGVALARPEATLPKAVLALVDYSTGHQGKALQSIQQLIKTDPAAAGFLQSLTACLLIQSGDKGQALSLLRDIQPGQDQELKAFIQSLLVNEIGGKHELGNPARRNVI